MTKTIEALRRGLEVVDILRSDNGLTLTEIYHKSGIDRATLTRILLTLQEQGWVKRQPNSFCYQLAFFLDSPSAAEQSIDEVLAPILSQLGSEIGWPTDIAIRDGLSMKIIETTRPDAAFMINRNVLGYRPSFLFSAVGRAYLAFCAEGEREEILAGLKAQGGKEGRLVNDAVWLQQMLKNTNARGYGVREPKYWGVNSIEGRYIEAIAVPIFSHGKVTACINAAWPEGSVSDFDLEKHIFPALQSSAKDLADQFFN